MKDYFNNVVIINVYILVGGVGVLLIFVYWVLKECLEFKLDLFLCKVIFRYRFVEYIGYGFDVL